jgi:hypothetical protein
VKRNRPTVRERETKKRMRMGSYSFIRVIFVDGFQSPNFHSMRWRDRSPQQVLAWPRQVQEEALASLKAAPAAWFRGKERNPEWPGDLDGHSAYHRAKDIERALAAGDKG